MRIPVRVIPLTWNPGVSVGYDIREILCHYTLVIQTLPQHKGLAKVYCKLLTELVIGAGPSDLPICFDLRGLRND